MLRDAVNNEIEIIENAEYCLVYDRALPPTGLSWRELVDWWADHAGEPGAHQRENAGALYLRLRKSLDEGPEQLAFATYAARYGKPGGFDLPALIPQVYLHYDPYTRTELAALRAASGKPGELARQRMDFLMLLPDRVRIVIEVDGKQHYADGDAASPKRYAAMVAEDRRLRLAGYEVYRFGGLELTGAGAKGVLNSFFDQLLKRYEIGAAKE